MSFADWFSEMGWGPILLTLLVVVLLIIILFVMAGSPLFRSAAKRTTADSLVFWKSPDPGVALRIDTSEVGAGIPFTRYTLLVDMIWYNTRVRRQAAGENPYRHILHRGSTEVANYAANVPLLGDKPSDTDRNTLDTTTALDVIPFGLPTRMNPGIMADPYTNDMLIFFDTENGTRFYRESLRIPDIPMDQPFRLAIVVVERYIEVYLNCSLEATKMLEGIPRDVGREWFGLSGPVPLPAQVQNLRLFKDIVAHTTLRTYCGAALPVFKKGKDCATS
jgi:hypothetical protein